MGSRRLVTAHAALQEKRVRKRLDESTCRVLPTTDVVLVFSEAIIVSKHECCNTGCSSLCQTKDSASQMSHKRLDVHVNAFILCFRVGWLFDSLSTRPVPRSDVRPRLVALPGRYLALGQAICPNP